MILEQDISGRQELGNRYRQEDDYAFCEFIDEDGTGGLLMVLADGMGGHQAGQEASACAVRGAIEGFLSSKGAVVKRLAEALYAANDAIKMRIEACPDDRGMGTTLVVYCLTRCGLDYVSVGDSKLYHLRSGSLRRLNQDQTMASYFDGLAASGKMSLEEAQNHPERKSLSMALQGAPLSIEDCSLTPLALEAGDMIFAASDGIATLSDASIGEILMRNRDKMASSALIDLLDAVLAVGRRNQDNATVTLVKLSADWQDSLSLGYAAK